jgi:hypothetical protein
VCPTEKKSGVSGPDRSVKCAVVLNVPCERSWCAVDLCPPGPCGIMWRWDLPHSPPPQATGGSVWIDLDSVHLVDSRAAQSRICGYRTVYVDIVFYFSSSITVSRNTPQMVYPRRIDCCYLLGLINHTMEQKLPCVFITFSWAVFRTVRLAHPDKYLNTM